MKWTASELNNGVWLYECWSCGFILATPDQDLGERLIEVHHRKHEPARMAAQNGVK